MKKDFKFAKSHEWLMFIDETTARVGISDYAQHELGDLVFVNLPEVGDTFAAGEVFADIESVKAVSDLYLPVSGTISAINEELLDAPEIINEDAYEAWFVEITDIEFVDDLLDQAEYDAFIEAGGE